MIRLESVNSINVTNRSTWAFANFINENGVQTTVEITYGCFISEVVKTLIEMTLRIQNCEMKAGDEIESILGLTPCEIKGNQVVATAISTLRSAIIQIQAMSENLSLTEALGGQPVESVQLYANINRYLFGTDRTPAAYFQVAEKARNAGFQVFKCAPFDEITPLSTQSTITLDSAPGLERVVAVRNAIGPEAQLLVDCHSRFQPDTARFIADKLVAMDVAWLEEPVQPTDDLRRFIEVTQTIAIPVAGGESAYGADFFAEVSESKPAIIVMPDVKYCGGVSEAVKIGHHAITHGAGFSVHSPSGPISQLASGHVTAAVVGSMPLEHAVYEADWRSGIIEPPEIIKQGRLWMPIGSGIGASLNYDNIKQFDTVWP